MARAAAGEFAAAFVVFKKPWLSRSGTKERCSWSYSRRPTRGCGSTDSNNAIPTSLGDETLPTPCLPEGNTAGVFAPRHSPKIKDSSLVRTACSVAKVGRSMSEGEQPKDKRVAFERPIEARLMAIDGTWQRGCKIHDVSETGAKLVIDGAVTDIGQKEFFLVLSPMGLAYRHCELAWVNGEFVGVQFINRGRASKRARRGETLVS
ncbi:hypothetical protein ACVWZ4_006046 [Bradyrhizobium sp. USDA 4472]